MDQFLEKQKLTGREVDHSNGLASIKENESVVNNLSKRKHQPQMGSMLNPTRDLREKGIPFLYNLF